MALEYMGMHTKNSTYFCMGIGWIGALIMLVYLMLTS